MRCETLDINLESKFKDNIYNFIIGSKNSLLHNFCTINLKKIIYKLMIAGFYYPDMRLGLQ